MRSCQKASASASSLSQGLFWRLTSMEPWPWKSNFSFLSASLILATRASTRFW